MEETRGFIHKYSLDLCKRKEDLCNLDLDNRLKYIILMRTAIALDEDLLLHGDDGEFFLCHRISNIIGLNMHLDNKDCASIFKYLYMFKSDILTDEEVIWFESNEERLWSLLFAAEMYRLDSMNEKKV